MGTPKSSQTLTSLPRTSSHLHTLKKDERQLRTEQPDQQHHHLHQPNSHGNYIPKTLQCRHLETLNNNIDQVRSSSDTQKVINKKNILKTLDSLSQHEITAAIPTESLNLSGQTVGIGRDSERHMACGRENSETARRQTVITQTVVRERGVDVGNDREVTARRKVGVDPTYDKQYRVSKTSDVLLTNTGDSILRIKNNEYTNHQVIDDKFIITLKPTNKVNSYRESTKNIIPKNESLIMNLWHRIVNRKQDSRSVERKTENTQEHVPLQKHEVIHASHNELYSQHSSTVSHLDSATNQPYYCYDNPSFSRSFEKNASTNNSALPLDALNSTVTDNCSDNFASSDAAVPSSEKFRPWLHSNDSDGAAVSSNSSYSVSNSNIKMKSTSVQTKINIDPITSVVLTKKSDISRSTPNIHNLRNNRPSFGCSHPTFHSSNSYITTSEVSTEAVVEVAKVMRAKMQQQQRQKEQRHRQAMETSSVRYMKRAPPNHQESSDPFEKDDPEGLHRFTSLPICHESSTVTEQPASLKTVSALVNSFESSARKVHSLSFSNITHSKEENKSNMESNRFIRSENLDRYFNSGWTNSYGRAGKELVSFQGVLSRSNEIEPRQTYSSLDSNRLYVEKNSPQQNIYKYKKRIDLSNNSLKSFTDDGSGAGGIVYAELSFPESKTKTFNVFGPKKIDNSLGDLQNLNNKINYTTLLYPSPSSSDSVNKCDEITI